MKLKKKLFICTFIVTPFVISNGIRINAMDNHAFDIPSLIYNTDNFEYMESHTVDGTKNQSVFYGEYRADANSKYENELK